MQALFSNQILIIIAILFLTYCLSKRIETFTGAKAIVTVDEYLQDIRNLNSYVGPYIGEIYNYLRAKYFNPEKNISLGPMFQPAGLTDPTLADPLLPIARAQLKGWIDSAKLRITQKYGQVFLSQNAPKYDLFYEETTDKILKIVNVKNGEATTYLV